MTTTRTDGEVAFFGLFGVGNIGNEASLASALASLAQMSSASPVVICSRPEIVEALHGVRAVSMHMQGAVPNGARWPRPVRLLMRPFIEVARWIAAYRFLRSVDAVVVPGTGILDDFGEPPHGMPYELFRWTLTARLARAPMSFTSVGAGPVDHPLSRVLVRQTVRQAAVCTYRDEGSAEFMKSLGATVGHDALRPDVAFSLRRPTPDAAPADQTCIGVGMMAYYGWHNDPAAGTDVFDSYIASMVEITSRLLDRGHTIRILIGERTDDAAVAALLGGLRAASQPVDRVEVPPIDDFDDLLTQVGTIDAVVATRYHNVIASLMMAIPTVSIGYAEKNRDLLRSAGLDTFAYDVDAIDVDEILAAVDRALDDAPTITPALRRWVGECSQRVEAQFAKTFAPS